MSQKFIYLAGAALLLTVAAGCNKAAQQNVNVNAQANVQSNSSANAQANASASQNTSLKDLLALGQSRKCTMNFTTGQTTSSGTIYVSGGKMRGDFTAQIGGKAMTSHMIQDSTNVYSWVDGMGMGFKMAIGAQASASANGSAAASTPDLSKKMDYNCQSWSADNAMFTLPSGVTFSAMVVPTVPKVPVVPKVPTGSGY